MTVKNFFDNTTFMKTGKKEDKPKKDIYIAILFGNVIDIEASCVPIEQFKQDNYMEKYGKHEIKNFEFYFNKDKSIELLLNI